MGSGEGTIQAQARRSDVGILVVGAAAAAAAAAIGMGVWDVLLHPDAFRTHLAWYPPAAPQPTPPAFLGTQPQRLGPGSWPAASW